MLLKRYAFALISVVASISFFQNCARVQFASVKEMSSEKLSNTFEVEGSCQFNGQQYLEGESVEAFQNSSVPSGSECLSQYRVCRGGVMTGSFNYMRCQSNVAKDCLFNGQNVMHGQAVQAYQNSTVAYGSNCIVETRLCQDGELSGSYNFGSCKVGVVADCKFNGKDVAHNSTVVGYFSSAVPYGSFCKGENRLCANGALSGTYQYGNCEVGKPASCLFNGKTVAHNEKIISYLSSTVGYGKSCDKQERTCENGQLSGSNNYKYASCEVDKPASCLLDGKTYAHNEKVIAYLSSSSDYAKACDKQERICDNGKFSGLELYKFTSCEVAKPVNCVFNGQAILHGESVTAYLEQGVPFTGACNSEARVCNNGELTGTYSFSSCEKALPANCSLNGQSVEHGKVINAYLTSQVSYGSQCVASARTCDNGSLLGNSNYTFGSCYVDQPADCSLENGQPLKHGASISVYANSSVPFGSSCVSQSRTCNNGSLTGTQAYYASCSVEAAKNCSFNGKTVMHGASVTSYATTSVPFGSSCISQSRTCNNGELSSGYQAPACQPEAPKSCTFGGDTYFHGEKIAGFNTDLARYTDCVSSTRTCLNGAIDGYFLDQFGRLWENSNQQKFIAGFYATCRRWEKGSPLMIHMNSDTQVFEPLKFSSPLDGINFDILGQNSSPEPHALKRISWYTSSQYYFLTLPNSQGQVKGVDELFGDNTTGPDGQFAKDGYKALAKFDGMQIDGVIRVLPADGLITVQDPIYSHLRLWNDRNHDGISSQDELFSLDEMGIVTVDLNADESYKEVDIYGNETTLKSVVKTKDGRYHLMFDIWFQYEEPR
jgi:hypothetical protein